MKRLYVIVILVVLGLGAIFWQVKGHGPTKTSPRKNTSSNQTPSFNKTLYALDKPESIWVVVNKRRLLSPKDFAPSDLARPNVLLRAPDNESMQLRANTVKALESMFTAAKADKLQLMLSSGYRSYNYQVTLYGGYVQTMGQSTADKTSARPGYSEHQTGLAADIEPVSKKCEVELCFADTPEGKWLAANAYKYGFIIRYPVTKVPVTGYEYEPWHVRYVGPELATEMHRKSIQTLEEYFELPAAPDYLR